MGRHGDLVEGGGQMGKSLPPWLSIDLNLLESDVQQLRLHLGWLLEDLRAHQSDLGRRAETPISLTDETELSLAGLVGLDDLLARLRC
jgi:hypothetical protein